MSRFIFIESRKDTQNTIAQLGKEISSECTAIILGKEKKTLNSNSPNNPGAIYSTLSGGFD